MNSITTRVWIAGASGRLGSALSHRFGGNTAYKLVTSDRDVAVEDVSVVGRFADINHPDVIINCAGLTDVQACEENPEEAYKINAIGARNLATAARRIDAKFIQISTDDVFGGDEGKAFCEFDDPHPTTMYGKSKYAGEKLVRELTDKHVIVRSSWLYGVGSYDFVDRVLDTAAKEGAVHLPEDEISSPTSAEALAGCTAASTACFTHRATARAPAQSTPAKFCVSPARKTYRSPRPPRTLRCARALRCWTI